jgi:hypothetical protein
MIEVNETRSGQNGHRVLAVDLDDDGFREFLARDARQFCDPLRRVGWRVADGDILDVVFVEIVFQLLDRHLDSP